MVSVSKEIKENPWEKICISSISHSAGSLAAWFSRSVGVGVVVPSGMAIVKSKVIEHCQTKTAGNILGSWASNTWLTQGPCSLAGTTAAGAAEPCLVIIGNTAGVITGYVAAAGITYIALKLSCWTLKAATHGICRIAKRIFTPNSTAEKKITVLPKEHAVTLKPAKIAEDLLKESPKLQWREIRDGIYVYKMPSLLDSSKVINEI